MQYRVVWKIDLDEDSPGEAARQALEILCDPESIAICFIVMDEKGNRHDVDLANNSP